MKGRARRLSRWFGALAAGFWMAGAFADIAIVGGRVYTMESPEPLREATVLIAGGRIEAVGTDIKAPFEYRQIDATGKIVTPGPHRIVQPARNRRDLGRADDRGQPG